MHQNMPTIISLKVQYVLQAYATRGALLEKGLDQVIPIHPLLMVLLCVSVLKIGMTAIFSNLFSIYFLPISVWEQVLKNKIVSTFVTMGIL